MEHRNRSKKERDHSFLHLPEEIRGIIFNKIPQNQVLQLRLVSKKWEKEINNYFNFKNIKLDERSPYFRNILQLRILSLEIISLKDHEYRMDPTRKDEDKRPELIFKNTNLVQKLTIKRVPGNNVPPNEQKISPQNLQELLQLLSKSLKSLSLGISMGLMSQVFHPNITYDFLNLTHLRIDVDDVDVDGDVDIEAPVDADSVDIDPNDDFDAYIAYMDSLLQTPLEETEYDNSILTQLIGSKYPKLESLEIGGYSRETPRSFWSIIKLINIKPPLLNRLWIDFEGGSNNSPRRDIQEKHLLILRSVRNLQLIRIKFNIPGYHYSVEEMSGMFSDDLILNQRKLRILDLSNDTEYLNIRSPFPVNQDFLKSLTLNNFETLETVSLNALLVGSEIPIDLSVFKYCHKLRSLTLGRYGIYEHLTAHLQELSNLKDLPPNMRHLAFRGFNILTPDLVTFLDSGVVQGLETLEISRSGATGDFGITLRVIQRIRRLKERRFLDPMILLSGFNESDIITFPNDFPAGWARLQSREHSDFSIRFEEGYNPNYTVLRKLPGMDIENPD